MLCFDFGRSHIWEKVEGCRPDGLQADSSKIMCMPRVRVQVVSEWLGVSSTVGILSLLEKLFVARCITE